MRTKTLICAAALAAGVATSMAQSNVYSLNVVGYVNKALTGGFSYNMIANPLNNTAVNGNNITNLFKLPAGHDGDQIIRWDSVNAGFQGDTYVWDEASSQWLKNGATLGGFVLNVGEGVFYINQNANMTNTFVGDVIQGPFTNNLSGGFAYNAVGSSAPLGGNFTNSIGGLNPIPVAGHDGDQIAFWDIPGATLSGNSVVYDEAGSQWVGTPNNNLNIGIAEGFFYINQGANLTWVRNFTVQ
jgi:hypothetical protein